MSLVIKPIQNSSDYVLDNLSATTRSANTVAFSFKPLSQSYTGPIIRLRHSATGATKDFYANTSGNLGDNYGGSGITPETWIGTNNLATVDTWYDQSGNSRNATQTTVANQPILLKRSNGYVVAFNASSLHFMSYTSSIWHNTNYTAIIKEQRSSSKIDNYFHGTTTESTNANLHIGYRTNTQFTHSQFANDYNYNVNGFAIYDTTNTYSPISSYTTGTPILSIDSPYTTPEGSFGFDGITGKYIRINATALTSGFQWWTNGGCTMECWVKYTSFTNASRPTYIVPTLFGNMNPTTGDAHWGFGATTTGIVTFYYWNGARNNINTTTTISLNTWTHIAMTCDATNIRIFINGVLSAGPIAISGNPGLNSPFTVGQHYNLSPIALISNARIVKGVALYTSNFTPSVTSPLTTASSGTTLLLLRVPTSINRWLVSHHTTDVPGKRMYLNGTQVASLANNVSLSSPGQATLGRYGPTPSTRYFTGDLYHFMGFNISLPVSDPNAIITIDNYLNYANRIPRIKTTSAIVQRGISIPTGNVFAGIPPSVLNTCIGAFSARRIIQSYNGPIFRLRRDSDNNEVDVWIDYEGNVERVVDLSLDDGLSFGGTITYDGAYRIHTFTTNGTFATSNVRVCDLLVVGGGGGGGTASTYNPGGGGGGGEVYFKTNSLISSGVYTTTIGGGGLKDTNGGNSSFGLIVAKGGGKGGYNFGTGGNGGSGGGGARSGLGGQSIKALGKGYSGGTSGGVAGVSAGGGGGGGATQVGQNAINGNGGNRGGEGLACSISGTNVVYGSGGGGARRLNSYSIGYGGTNAGNSGYPGSNAISNLGGGGGGGDAYENNFALYPIAGGQGGSGIVLVRTLRHQGIQGRNALTQWLGSSTATMTKWYDQSGNVNHVTTIRGNPRVSSYPNDTYIYGNINDGLRFPGAILPSNYTLIHTAQYTNDFKLANWTITGFTGGTITLTEGTLTEFNYYQLSHGSATYSSDPTYAMYIFPIPTNVIAANYTLYIDAYIMRTGPTAANTGALILDFMDSSQTVVGSSITLSYVNITLNVWINSQGSVALPTTAKYIRVRFGINYNETIRLRKDTLITVKNSGNATITQWYMGDTRKRIFDGITSDWASGFLNGYAGVASHSTSNIKITPANGAVITSLNGWSGFGVGGSAGPILDRNSSNVPHIALNGTSTTVGDYFNFGNTNWDLSSNGGFSFIGMVKINTSARSWQRIFDFGNGQANKNILATQNGTSSTFTFEIYYDNPTTNSYKLNVTNGITIGSWQIFAGRIQNEGINTWRSSVWINGVKTTGAQYTTTLINRELTNSYIGRSHWGADSYADIDYREMLFYNDDLSDTQINNLYNYMNQKFNILGTPWLEPPITPYLRFQPYYAYQVSPQPFLASYPPNNTVITSINGATGYGVGGSAGPIYDTSTGNPHIAFNGVSSTVGDYLDYGSTTWNIATNGGFTFIGMVRFNTITSSRERVFNLYKSGGTEVLTRLLLARVGTTNTISVYIGNLTTLSALTVTNGIVNGSWQIFACRVQNEGVDTWRISLWINNIKTTGSTFTMSMNDLITTNSYIGRSDIAGDIYSDIDYRELLFYNSALPDAQINTLYQYLDNKYNNQTLPWFSTAPITPYLQTTPQSLIQNTYSSNLVVSVDQNVPNLYRANGVLYNSGSYGTSNTQLSINYGASGEYSDWIVKDVVVFNNTLSSTNISMVESALMLRRLGILDQVAPSTKATVVAAYSFRLLTVTYTGPCVKIRRATDNAEKDFYASTTGDLGDLYLGRGQTLKEWLNGATGYVRTWYDQTGRAKHVEQGSTASQPTIVFSNTQGNGIYFTNTFLSGANVFDTTTVSNMHIVMASREIARVSVLLFNLNGDNGNTPGRFAAHIPYTTGIVYFDVGSTTTDRARSPVNILSVGQKSVFSGYKSSSEGKNGFRINKGTRYLSSGITTADVSGGIRMGQMVGISANHNIYAFIVFNTKLNTTDELLIENNIAPFK